MAKNKKDRKKNRLLVLLLLLIMMLGFTGVETYAWFTANRKVSMTGVQVGVSTKNGLLISVDGKESNAGTTVSQLDFNEYRANCNSAGTCAISTYNAQFNASHTEHDYYNDTGNNNLFPAKIDNISSAGEQDSDGSIKFFSAVVEPIDDSIVDGVEKNNYHMTSATQIAAASACTAGTGEACSGPYVAFDLYLHLSTASQITLTDSSSLTTTATTGDIAARAARVALVYQGTTNPSSVVACGEGQTDGATDAATGSLVNDCNSTGTVFNTNTNSIKANTYLWEPNAAAHNDTTTGDAWGMILYGSNPTNAQTYYGIKKEFRYSDTTYADTLGKTIGLPFQTYFNDSNSGETTQSNGIFNFESSKTYGYRYVNPDTLARSIQTVTINGSDYFKKMETGGSLIFRNAPSNRVLFNFGELPAGVSKFRVYLWIEGMDADTRDEIIDYQADQTDSSTGSTDLTDMKLALQFAMN